MTRCIKCGAELLSPGAYCIYCGYAITHAVLIFQRKDKVNIVCFDSNGDVVGIEHIKSYLHLYHHNDEGYYVSLRNLAYLIFEKVHNKRPKKVYFSLKSCDLEKELEHYMPYELIRLHTESLEESIKTVRRLELRGRGLVTVNIPPMEKLGGKHTTIIGGRRGLELILEIAKIPYVKKIIPGRIHAKGSKGGGGVRIKVSRVDDYGNIKLILSEGCTNQDIYVVTTASTYDEGLKVVEMIKEKVKLLC